MIKLKNIVRTYGSGDAVTKVLKGIDLEIGSGEFIAIMGPSGSGKSTLLNILGTLDTPTSGTYTFLDTDVVKLSKDQKALFRRYMLGFIFQSFNLLKKTSALENVEMPLIYLGVSVKQRKQRAHYALATVGLENRINYDPCKLAGGQQQRVAIARAIVTNPKLIIADEPTGNLDTKRGHEIMQIMQGFNKQGITVIVVTHAQNIASYASRVIYLLDGQIEKEQRNAT